MLGANVYRALTSFLHYVDGILVTDMYLGNYDTVCLIEKEVLMFLRP